MSMHYSQRAILETKVANEEVMVYLDGNEPTLNNMNRFMLSTDMYVNCLDRAVYQCDIFTVNGIEEPVMVEFRKDMFGFMLYGMETESWYPIKEHFDNIETFLGTFYDDKVVRVIGEQKVML